MVGGNTVPRAPVVKVKVDNIGKPKKNETEMSWPYFKVERRSSHHTKMLPQYEWGNCDFG